MKAGGAKGLACSGLLIKDNQQWEDHFSETNITADQYDRFILDVNITFVIEQEEPDESRGSRPVLWEHRGETPRCDPTSSNLMTTLNIQRDKSAWLLFIATLLLTGLFAFINLSEFITVGVLKQTSGYSFGGESPTPWFYRSAQLYTTVSLVFGILFLLALATGVWSFIRVKKNVLITCFGVSLFFILLQLLTGQSA